MSDLLTRMDPWIHQIAAAEHRRALRMTQAVPDLDDFLQHCRLRCLEHDANAATKRDPIRYLVSRLKWWCRELLGESSGRDRHGDQRRRDALDQVSIDPDAKELPAIVGEWSRRVAGQGSDDAAATLPRSVRRLIGSLRRVDREVLHRWLAREEHDAQARYRALRRLAKKLVPRVVTTPQDRACQRGHPIPAAARRCPACQRQYRADHQARKNRQESVQHPKESVQHGEESHA